MELIKKYELTSETKKVDGRTLYRIKAKRSFGDVQEGELGGWIESEGNLCQHDDSWVYAYACVYDKALVCGNARAYDTALVDGNARVYDIAHVHGNAHVYDTAWVGGNAMVCGNAMVAKADDLVLFGNVGGSRDFHMTAARSSDAQILIAIGCFRGTMEEFEAEMEAELADRGAFHREMLVLTQYIKLRLS